jgi:hypothetical protein
MQLERVRPMVIRMTLHTYEATALITAARWVADGTQGELPEEAVEQLREVLASYDDALSRIAEPSRSDGGSRN